MQTIRFSTPSVHCRSCQLNIEEALEELPGVTASDVDLDARSVTVTYDPATVDHATIGAAIAAAGYPVSDSSSS